MTPRVSGIITDENIKSGIKQAQAILAIMRALKRLPPERRLPVFKAVCALKGFDIL